MSRKKLKPVHPGEILAEEFMAPLKLSMNRMALDLRVPVTRIADIVNEPSPWWVQGWGEVSLLNCVGPVNSSAKPLGPAIWSTVAKSPCVSMSHR